MGTKERVLTEKRGNQGNSKPRDFWVGAAPPRGREHYEDRDHDLFISVAPQLGWACFF